MAENEGLLSNWCCYLGYFTLLKKGPRTLIFQVTPGFRPTLKKTIVKISCLPELNWMNWTGPPGLEFHSAIHVPLLYPKKDIKWSAIFEIKVDAIGKCMVSVEGVVLNSVWDTVPFFFGGLSKSSEGSSEKSLVFFSVIRLQYKVDNNKVQLELLGPYK